MKVEFAPGVTSEDNRTRLTHIKTDSGWKEMRAGGIIKKIVYLGKCTIDGDCFAVYRGGCIVFCKGFLNAGIY